MGALLLELLPSAVGLALTPAAILATVLFLSSNRPIANVLMFAAPFALIYGGLSLIVLTAAQTSTGPLLSAQTKHAVTLAVGFALVVFAAEIWFRSTRRPRRAGRPRLFRAVDAANPAAAFGIGCVLAVFNPNIAILAGGLTTILAAHVPAGERAAGAALLEFGAVAGILGPLVWYVTRPTAARRGLAAARAWLTRHLDAINISVLLFFGVGFMLKGLRGFMQ